MELTAIRTNRLKCTCQRGTNKQRMVNVERKKKESALQCDAVFRVFQPNIYFSFAHFFLSIAQITSVRIKY